MRDGGTRGGGGGVGGREVCKYLVWFLSVSLGLSIFVQGEEEGQDNVSPALQERRMAKIIVYSLISRRGEWPGYL